MYGPERLFFRTKNCHKLTSTLRAELNQGKRRKKRTNYALFNYTTHIVTGKKLSRSRISRYHRQYLVQEEPATFCLVSGKKTSGSKVQLLHVGVASIQGTGENNFLETNNQ